MAGGRPHASIGWLLMAVAFLSDRASSLMHARRAMLFQPIRRAGSVASRAPEVLLSPLRAASSFAPTARAPDATEEADGDDTDADRAREAAVAAAFAPHADAIGEALAASPQAMCVLPQNLISSHLSLSLRMMGRRARWLFNHHSRRGGKLIRLRLRHSPPVGRVVGGRGFLLIRRSCVIDDLLGDAACRTMRAEAEAIRDAGRMETVASSGDVRGTQVARGDPGLSELCTEVGRSRCCDERPGELTPNG